MTDVGPTRAPVEPRTGSAESSAQRMHQRLEWERAFLAAQPEPRAGRRENPQALPEDTVARPAERATPNETTLAAGPAGRSTGPTTGSDAGGDAPRTTAAFARGAQRTPGRAEEPVPPLPVASRQREAALPRARRPASPAPPAPTPPRAQPKPFAMRFFEHDGAVRVWLRDVSLSRDAGAHLAGRLRHALGRIGLRLSELTVNGTKLVGGEDGTRGTEDPERELDISY